MELPGETTQLSGCNFAKEQISVTLHLFCFILIFNGGALIYYWIDVARHTSELVVAVVNQKMNDRLYTTRKRRQCEPETEQRREEKKKKVDVPELWKEVEPDFDLNIFRLCWFCTRTLAYHMCKSCFGTLKCRSGCLFRCFFLITVGSNAARRAYLAA